MVWKSFLGTLICFAALCSRGESVLCEIGEALKDPSNPSMDRQCFEGAGTTSCPADYVCTARNLMGQPSSSVCCPSKALACSQPQMTGSSCGAAMPVQRYYFDPNQGSCLMFTYSGCFGNTNNFFTKDECERTCLSSLCPRGTPARTNFGQLQRCQFGSSQCSQNYDCVPVSGSPSMGSVCCPTQASICSQPMQSGSPCSLGNQPMQRYYFEPTSRMCQMFQFMGCFGNDNNFATMQECQQYCSGSGPSSELCPAGSSPAPGTTASTPCNQFSTCPPGYSCQFSPALRQQYCCSSGTPGGQFCPAGMTPQPGTTVSTPCNPSFPGSCQNGYTCQQSPQGQFYCCSSSISTNICPAGSTPGPGVSIATPCSASIPCTQGYACEYSSQNGQYYCCSSRDPFGEMCPSGSNPAPGTTILTPCTPGGTPSCTTGYTCRQSSNGRSYCCSTPGPVQTQLCPMGQNPAPGVTVSTTCSPFASSCTPGFTCQQSPFNQMWYCCGSGGGGSQLCPAGSQPAPGITVQTPCNPSLPCQPGYSCQRSPFNNQMYCCSSTTPGGQFCPAGSTPAPGVSINTPCTMGSACPQGYFCQQSPTSSQSYCCSSSSPSSQLCPTGWTAAPEASINQPCNPFTACRSGYSCQRSPFNGQSYCCMFSGSSSTLCPAGSNPAPNVNQGTPCDPSTPCQFGYSCQRSPSNGFSYCCSSSTASQLCPFGSNPPPGTTAANTCNPFTPCPFGYTCQASPFTGQMYCCSSGGGGGSGLCPAGSTPAPGVTANNPCNSDNACQMGFTCQPSPSGGFRYCCSQSGGQQCPFGGTPLIQPGTGQPLSCMVGGQPCQQPYTCQASSGSQWGVCCLSGQGGQDCPQGFNVYRPNGQVINCGFGGVPQQQMCQPFGQCMMSPTRQTYICCSTFTRTSRGLLSAQPISCKTDGDCSSVKEAACIDNVCQCISGHRPSQGQNCRDFPAANDTNAASQPTKTKNKKKI